jgi:predicted DNA-binding antitoxin AbrB/MazE fold protein
VATHFEAVFENGILRPLEPLRLPENARVRVTIEPETELSLTESVQIRLSEEDWQQFCEALDAPPKNIPALRKLLTEPSVFDARQSLPE